MSPEKEQEIFSWKLHGYTLAYKAILDGSRYEEIVFAFLEAFELKEAKDIHYNN